MRGSTTTKSRHVILDFDMVSKIVTFEDKGIVRVNNWLYVKKELL